VFGGLGGEIGIELVCGFEEEFNSNHEAKLLDYGANDVPFRLVGSTHRITLSGRLC
jgi:hypothetical protein